MLSFPTQTHPRWGEHSAYWQHLLVEHNGSAVSVLDEHSDEGHADEDIIGVIVLHEENMDKPSYREECGDIPWTYLSGKGLLAKAVQFLHLLDVQQLCFSRLHSTGEQKAVLIKHTSSFSITHASRKLELPVTLVFLRDLLCPLLQHLVSSRPVLRVMREGGR